jgi:uncharacterized protein YecE (DUF72 family)
MTTKQIHLGTSGWKYDDWKGPFYPDSPADELALYARRFSTVEIDSTWYRTPARHVVDSWRKRVPDGFRFAAKVPRAITHDKALVDCEAEFNEFLRAMSCLEDRLGPILFQFPPQWNASEGARALREFLPLLPCDWKFAMEFRHRSWYHDEYSHLLRDAGVAWTLADPNQFPPRVYATAPFTYIRWLGNRYEALEPLNSLKKDRDAEEAHWAQVIEELPVQEVWGYFNNHWAGFSPGSVMAFKERLGLPTQPLQDPPQQGSLF